MTGQPVFASTEVATIWSFLRGTMERMTGVAAELSIQELAWTPPAPETNSISVLLIHTMGNIEENILEIVAGELVNRVRAAEFVANDVTGADLAERWLALSGRLEPALAAIGDDQLESMRSHPRRGEITARTVLLQATTHAGEHLGQVELTRDLALAAELS